MEALCELINVWSFFIEDMDMETISRRKASHIKEYFLDFDNTR